METKYTAMVKDLFQEYYKRNMSHEDYRSQRNKIIREMDIEFNSSSNIQHENTNASTHL